MTVFDRNGKTLEWRGKTFRGDVQRTYVYDESERLIRVITGEDEVEEEYRYDGDRKAQTRRIRARTDRQNCATGFSIFFEAVSEGDVLTDGGSVETKYNDRDQPTEKRILDDEGMLVHCIEYVYDAHGRLSEEKLITENPPFPKAFRDQIPIEQREAVFAEMTATFHEAARGLFGDTVRTYVYDEQGHVAERHMRMGPMREDLTFSYNEHGDISELRREQSGSLDGSIPLTQLTLEVRREYEYDSFGNWTRMMESSGFSGNVSMHTPTRQLTYHL